MGSTAGPSDSLASVCGAAVAWAAGSDAGGGPGRLDRMTPATTAAMASRSAAIQMGVRDPRSGSCSGGPDSEPRRKSSSLSMVCSCSRAIKTRNAPCCRILSC